MRHDDISRYVQGETTTQSVINELGDTGVKLDNAAFAKHHHGHILCKLEMQFLPLYNSELNIEPLLTLQRLAAVKFILILFHC